MTRIVLDISRLVSRIRHSAPSGVDRVEMAYARGLLALYGEKMAFAAVHPSGFYGRISRTVAVNYLDELEGRWSSSSGDAGQRSLASVAPWMARLMPKRAGVGSADVLIQVSPHHLDRKERKRRILAREQAKFVCMVHDLIPIEYPEYARPGGAALHEQRMQTVAELADAVIVNSAATGTSLARWIERQGGVPPPCHVAHLGTEPVAPAAPYEFAGGKPYFLCLGTIEPRKNHLLLLHIWRSMAETLESEDIPGLVIVGRRGWENEQIVDLLDRCDAISPFVTEISGCGDAELASIMRGAQALLMPSFAEGYGMPIAEAPCGGVPVVASDIAAHREVGGDTPDFRDPLDGPGWQEAILDYAKDGPLRRAQMGRIGDWQEPSWHRHMEIARDLIEGLTQ